MCPALQPVALARYPGWNRANLNTVHDQVNELKHKPQGIYHGRTVTYAEALTRPPPACSTSSRAWAAATTPARKK
jgi:hypothetical protein